MAVSFYRFTINKFSNFDTYFTVVTSCNFYVRGVVRDAS